MLDFSFLEWLLAK